MDECEICETEMTIVCVCHACRAHVCEEHSVLDEEVGEMLCTTCAEGFLGEPVEGKE